MLEKLRNFFKFKPSKFLGLDIGTSAVRIVELSRDGRGYRLENYGEVKTSSIKAKPFRTFNRKNSLSLSNKHIAKAIQLICQEAEIETKEGSFSIPDFCTFFTSFDLPEMGKEEIAQAIRYEVRPYIPLPLEEVVLDWIIIEGKPHETPLKVLVAAIPNDVISQYREIAQLAGLELKTLESEVFALARVVGRNKNNKEILGLIDIGARSTTCSIMEKGVLKTSYSFNVAGNELTEIIANSLNIGYNKAEEIKKEQGLGKEARKILVPLVDSILEEIKKAFRNFYLSEGKEVKELVLAGSQVLMPGLKEYFSASLKKPAKIVDPFSNINYPPALTNRLKEMGPSFAVSLGLAMRGLK